MKRKSLVLVAFLTLVLAAGCAPRFHKPSYDMSNIQKVAAENQKRISVIVLPERYTGHKTTGNIQVNGLELAKTIAEHLKKCRLFSEVQAVKDWKEANGLKGKFDAIVAVKVLFYEGDKLYDRTVQNIGYVTRNLPSSYEQKLIGTVVEGMGTHKKALLSGYVTLEVVLKDDAGATLWEGTLKGEAKGEGRGSLSPHPPPFEIADEALKDAVNNMVKKLKEVAF